jgi:hypothetical protein
MQVMVSIVLSADDTLNMTADEIAAAVLEGLNGDPSKDSVMSNVQQAPETGIAGMGVPTSPPLPPPPVSP